MPKPILYWITLKIRRTKHNKKRMRNLGSYLFLISSPTTKMIMPAMRDPKKVRNCFHIPLKNRSPRIYGVQIGLTKVIGKKTFRIIWVNVGAWIKMLPELWISWRKMESRTIHSSFLPAITAAISEPGSENIREIPQMRVFIYL